MISTMLYDMIILIYSSEDMNWSHHNADFTSSDSMTWKQDKVFNQPNRLIICANIMEKASCYFSIFMFFVQLNEVIVSTLT